MLTIYSCIVGNYDSLLQPEVLTPDASYICFTDNVEYLKKGKIGVWEIRPMPLLFYPQLPMIKQQRMVKILPHLVLDEGDIDDFSIWVDGNILIRENLNILIKDVSRDFSTIFIPRHPLRKCIYEEAKAVVALKKDSFANIEPQMLRYIDEGYPEGYGLLQSNILIRRHNREECIRFMEDWAKEVREGSHRDQLSFNYVCWKNPDIRVAYMKREIADSMYFKWSGKHLVRKEEEVGGKED